jgi:hypothetical protein
MACPKSSKTWIPIAFAQALLLTAITSPLGPLQVSTPRGACRIQGNCLLFQACPSRAAVTSVSPRSAPVKAIIVKQAEEQQVKPSCRSRFGGDPMASSSFASEVRSLASPSLVRASHPLRC